MKSNLINGSIIWDFINKTTEYPLEEVQHLFLRYNWFKINNLIRYNIYIYKTILLKTLKKARQNADASIVYNILNNRIDTREIMPMFTLYNLIRKLRPTKIISNPPKEFNKMSIIKRLSLKFLTHSNITIKSKDTI